MIGLPKFKLNKKIKCENATAQKDRLNWSHKIFGIPDIWKQTQGANVRVAVLDTGCDTDHPDLRDAIIDVKDFTGDGIEDVNGHGTHCAGVIGARKNDIGFVGMAPECNLLIAKVLGNNGSGSYYGIANGIRWAISEGAQIISMSLGGPNTDKNLFKAIHEALAAGVSVICAAGNEGSIFQNSIGYPGRYGGVITVAAHDKNGNRSGFSSKGGEIDFMAPGSDIWSTYANGGYASLSGTSMATPFVAGIAALIAGAYRIDDCEEMRSELMKMASHPGYHDNTTGYGPLQPFGYFWS